VTEHNHLSHQQSRCGMLHPSLDFKAIDTRTGSDILADPTSCNANGVINADAKQQVLDRTSEYFPPEFLNRLDSILLFNKLSRESVLEVVSLRLDDVAKRLKNRRIALDVDGAPESGWLREGIRTSMEHEQSHGSCAQMFSSPSHKNFYRGPFGRLHLLV